MITNKNGNLLRANDVGVIVHQANLFHTFGAGIAAQILKEYPEAYQADLATKYGDVNKLGTYSYAASKGKFVANLYSQKDFSRNGSNATSYEHFKIGIQAIKKHFPGETIGVPHGIGCGLAGGDWNRVYKILQTVFAKDGNLIIYKYVPQN